MSAAWRRGRGVAALAEAAGAARCSAAAGGHSSRELLVAGDPHGDVESRWSPLMLTSAAATAAPASQASQQTLSHELGRAGGSFWWMRPTRDALDAPDSIRWMHSRRTRRNLSRPGGGRIEGVKMKVFAAAAAAVAAVAGTAASRAASAPSSLWRMHPSIRRPGGKGVHEPNVTSRIDEKVTKRQEQENANADDHVSRCTQTAPTSNVTAEGKTVTAKKPPEHDRNQPVRTSGTPLGHVLIQGGKR